MEECPQVRGEVAIIGLACTYPGARQMDRFWQNIVNRVDAISDVDPDHWDPAVFFDPDPAVEDRLYSKKGGWLPTNFTFNPIRFGIPPATVAGSEPDQFLLLRCVFEALQDAGYLNKDYDRERVSVIAGRGNYPGPGQTWLVMRTVVESVIDIMREMRPDLSEEGLQRLRGALKSKLPKLTPEGAGGIIPNVTTGRAANRFDFMGQNFSIDAACASALLATDIGVRNLLTGVDDMTLVGGLHICSQVPFLQIFKATRATSLTSVVRPFDEHADGTLGGEGVGMLVLKRLADAERDGDRIYAVIKGVGVASDGRAKHVLAPRVEGQTLAIRRALAMAEVSPDTIGLVECHGTATIVGDSTEIESLETAYGAAGVHGQTCAIGSVKSMIGHTMPAAGAASLIKTALALYHRVLPATLNINRPHPRLLDSSCRFYANTETKPWIQRTDGPPRRAGINAFGFGGINAHVVMEEYRKADESSLTSHLREWPCELVVVEGVTRTALVQALDRVREYSVSAEGVDLRDVAYTLNTSLTGAPCRVAIVAASLEELAQKCDKVILRLKDPKCKQLRERSGVFYFEDPEFRDGKLALLFPGEGAQYLNMMTDLCVHFPEARQCFDIADGAVKDPQRTPLSALLYPPPAFSKSAEKILEDRLWSLEHGTETVLTANLAMLAITESMQIRPHMMTGHSVGDWLAMTASGILDLNEMIGSMDRLDQIYQQLKKDITIPRRSMLAVGAGRERILKLAQQFHCEVEIANDNCPHQVVIVVDIEGSQAFVEQLMKNGVFVERLPYDGGYHTPSFTYMNAPLQQLFQSYRIQRAKTPVYCAMTAAPWPEDHDEVRRIASCAYSQPVLFTQTIERMYNDGARIFLEVGPRGNLTSFVDDILRGKPHLSVPMDSAWRPGLVSLNHAMGMLVAAGVPLDLTRLYSCRTPRKLSMDARQDSVVPEEREQGAMQVSKAYRYLYPPNGSEFPMPEAKENWESNGFDRHDHFANHSNGNGHSNGIVVNPEPVAREFEVQISTVTTATLVAETTAWPDDGLPAQEFVEAGTQALPMAVSQSSPVFAASSVPSSLLHDHFSVMAEFLRTQEDIMTLALSGSLPSNSSASAASGPWTTEVAAQSTPGSPSGAAIAATQFPLPAFEPWEMQTSSAGPVELKSDPVERESGPPAPDAKILLLTIVSERTGYPIEALDLDHDLEADLGIDSIKRVEIFSSLRQVSEGVFLSGEGDAETISKLKTLRQILTVLTESSVSPKTPAAAPVRKDDTRAQSIRSLIHDAIPVDENPGFSITLRMSIHLPEHHYLRDHSLTFAATEYNNQSNRIFKMPLTGTIEIACEAASLLAEPNQNVVSVSNIDIFRALQVLENEKPPVVEIVAKRNSPTEVEVSIQAQQGKAYARATVHFEGGYAGAPQPIELAPENSRPAKCLGAQIYTHRHMFHGPSFQGVRNIDLMADNGLLATLEVLPTAGLLNSDPHPSFYIDPFLLDAAGQLVGYWPIENCSRGGNVLPVRVQSVTKYADNPPAGTTLQCRMAVRHLSDQKLRADFDVLLPNGLVWMRVIGWEDWRLYWPSRIFDFAYGRLQNFESAGEPMVSEPLLAADFDGIVLAPLNQHERDPLLDESWSAVLFSREEFDSYRKLPPQKQYEALFTSTTTKDAVRAYARRKYNRKLFPADIELVEERPALTVSGKWVGAIPAPYVSSFFSHGWAFATAGSRPSSVAAIEASMPIPPGCFIPDEEQRLAKLPDADNWKRRAIVARQAAGLYLQPHSGNDFWQTLLIVALDPAEETFVLADPSSAVNAEDALKVITVAQGNHFVAVAFQS